MSKRRFTAGVAVVVAAALAGCGVGPGESGKGEATLTVTRDYGAEPVLEAPISDPPASETVIRALDREAEITTRYGGGFVQSIEGIEGEVDAGRSVDWFFYVNGVESSVGAAEVPVRAGDRIWWDYRDWTDAMRVPAVVGSWPEPFAQAATAEDERLPVEIECVGDQAPCDDIRALLADEGVDASQARPDLDASTAHDSRQPGRGAGDGETLRILVGQWSKLRRDDAASLLGDGPSASGVFAEPASGLSELVGLDERARPAARLGPGSGLVAALRDGEDPPTWLVTGTDQAGVEAASDLIDEETLHDRYAVATYRDEPLGLPVNAGGGG